MSQQIGPRNRDWRKGVDGGRGGDLYLRHGAMRSFPQDYEEGEYDPVIQINKRIHFGKGNAQNAAHAGIFFTEKNNGLFGLVQINARLDVEDERYCSAGLFFADKSIGVYGAEGVMILTATDGAYEIAHMFAVPYNKDNGTNVAFVRGPFPDLAWLFRDLYNARSTRREIFNTNYYASSTVNDARGGTVGCIAYIGHTSGEDAATPES